MSGYQQRGRGGRGGGRGRGDGRGGYNNGPRGGYDGGYNGNGRGGGRGGYTGNNNRHESGPPLPDMSSLSLAVAVDGTPLQMAGQQRAPTRNPVPGNTVDPKVFNKVLEQIRAHGTRAEFPLRKMLHATTTHVYTNHFFIKLDHKLPLYEYDIKGLPDKMSKKTTRVLVQNMIDTNAFLKANEKDFATDLARSIVSWVEFPNEALGHVNVSSREGQDAIGLWLELKGTVDTTVLEQYAEGKASPDMDTSNKIKSTNRALNMVISKALGNGSFSLKANKFFITGGHSALGGSLCTMRGYFYSIKPAMGQILLNLNACTSAFYQPILVSQFLTDDNTIKNQSERLSVLKGLRVHLTYEPKHTCKEPRSRAATVEASMKTVAGGGRACSQQTFKLQGRDGKPDEYPTVQAHFQKTYNITLKHPTLPAINCGTKERELWYPSEVLQILPYQLYKRKVPEGLTSDMLRVACHHPADTRALIELEGLKKLGLSPSGGFAPFTACPAILIDSRMLKVPAAVLSCPTINYGKNGKVEFVGKEPNGKWNLNGRSFVRANARAPLRVFIIVMPSDDGRSKLPDNVARGVYQGFVDATKTYSTGTPTLAGETTCPIFANPDVANKVMQMAKSKGANFVFLLLEKKNTSAYSNLKDLADRTFDMQSLCAVYKEDRHTGQPFGQQQWGNLMMKVNLKTGGVNHVSPDVAKVMVDTLVLGADVTHGGPTSLPGTPSIAAIVGSVDKDGGKFLGSMRLQPKTTACEDIDDVEGMVLERITAWFQNNKVLPKNILYYRDGVSDSQYTQVKDNELPQIRKAFVAAAKLRGIATVPNVKLTALVVAKRHHVRFFPGTDDPNYAKRQGREANGNCIPGTLVDSVVTSPYFQDFYLQSHDGLQGTAKSAHYFTLVNEMGLSEKDMQEFTHKLCYTYVRATMGVSYAPPAYYADRLCERGRCYLRTFLTPVHNSDFANSHRDMCLAVEKELKDKREELFLPLRTTNSKGRKIKSAEEKKQEDEDRETSNKTVVQRTFEQAKVTFYGPKKVVKNPWKEGISQTMFWM